MPDAIRTERLELVAADAELAAADAADDRMALEDLLDAGIAEAWPDAMYREARRFLARRLAAGPEEAGWWAWYVVLDAGEPGDRLLIGSVGFKGPPSAAGVVEIGYGILPTHQGRRFATEAVRGLIGWALRDARVMQVAAETFPDAEASLNLITRLGMTYVAESEADPGAVRFAASRAVLEQRAAAW